MNETFPFFFFVTGTPGISGGATGRGESTPESPSSVMTTSSSNKLGEINQTQKVTKSELVYNLVYERLFNRIFI